jgi:hypothetical protein
MIAAIHQPNYLPWLGYFYKMLKSDVFILVDNCQYIPRSYINRTRVKSVLGSEWMTIPIHSKGCRLQIIRDVRIVSPVNCFAEHQKTLWHRYGKAGQLDEYWPRLVRVYGGAFEKLCDLNVAFIKEICSILKIKTKIHLASEFPCGGTQTVRLVELCKAVNADTYLSGAGGRSYQDEELFKTEGIELRYSDFVHPCYEQRFGPFVEGLSIVDLLFNCGPAAREILENAGASVVSGVAQPQGGSVR